MAAATKYGSVDFPFTEDELRQGLTRTTDINKTIVVAMTCFLMTEPGQRRGNNVGSFLAGLKQTTISSTALKGISGDLKKELSDNFPGVIILDVELTQTYEDNTVNVHCKVIFQTPISKIEELNLLL